MTREELLGLLTHDNVSAFLRVIREGESSQDDSAYQVMFGGSHFESFEDHPRTKNTAAGLTSTAAGAYQFLERTWDEMARKYGLNDFGPTNQDIAACALILRRGALQDVLEGRIREAIRKCAKEWASLPGSPYGQPTLTLEKALRVYESFGGHLSGVPAKAPVKEEVNMAFPIAIIGPLLSAASTLIPQLGSLFATSENAKRNVAAGQIVAETLVKATEAVNLQDAVERIQTDPEVLQRAKEAVAQVWPSITESGGGGIAEARKQAYSPDQVPPWRNPAMWIALIFSPLIYGAAYAVLFTDRFKDDVKMMVVTAIFAGLLGAITGFFLGSSLGSQRKTEKM